jgi:hypothetical protein
MTLRPLSAADVVSSMAGFAAISIGRWSLRPTIDPQFISVATRDYPGRAAFQRGISHRMIGASPALASREDQRPERAMGKRSVPGRLF